MGNIIKHLNYKTFVNSYFWLVTLMLFFLGGLGLESVWVNWGAFLFTSFTLFFLYINQKKFYLPKYFNFLLVFYALFILSILWSSDPFKSFSYLLMVLAGGGYYLIGVNFNSGNALSSKDLPSKLVYLIISLVIVYTSVIIMELFMGVKNVGSFSLIRYASGSYNHHHIGDLAAILTAISINKYYLDKFSNKFNWIIVSILGLILVVYSQSRSALISLFAGFIYIIYSYGLVIRYKRIIAVLLGFLYLVLIYTISQKSLLLSRPYYWQAVEGIIKNPLGVGIGSFGVLSEGSQLKFLLGNAFSVVTHNLFLEILVGMGFLGVSFVLWVFLVVKDLMRGNLKKYGLIYATLVIVLTINFMFDFTYFIPIMLWLWFVSLGVAQTELKN